MKRKLLLCVLALIPAALLAQVAPDRPPRADRGEPAFKNQVFAGFGYTSLNQVNQSRYGLIGANVEYSRNFGRFFALTADGAYFPGSLRHHRTAASNRLQPSAVRYFSALSCRKKPTRFAGAFMPSSISWPAS